MDGIARPGKERSARVGDRPGTGRGQVFVTEMLDAGFPAALHLRRQFFQPFRMILWRQPRHVRRIYVGKGAVGMCKLIGQSGSNSDLNPFDCVNRKQSQLPVECVEVPDQFERRRRLEIVVGKPKGEKLGAQAIVVDSLKPLDERGLVRDESAREKKICLLFEGECRLLGFHLSPTEKSTPNFACLAEARRACWLNIRIEYRLSTSLFEIGSALGGQDRPSRAHRCADSVLEIGSIANTFPITILLKLVSERSHGPTVLMSNPNPPSCQYYRLYHAEGPMDASLSVTRPRACSAADRASPTRKAEPSENNHDISRCYRMGTSFHNVEPERRT